jgi:hypothetical protein
MDQPHAEVRLVIEPRLVILEQGVDVDQRLRTFFFS